MQSLFGTLLIVAGLAASCGSPAKKTYKDDGGDSGAGTESVGGISGIGVSPSARQLVTVPVTLINKAVGLNLLAPADTFTVTLVGCATGYTSTADENSTALQVYKFDKGCKAKLTTFDFNGRTYVPTAGDPFTTWAQNDTAVFDEAVPTGHALAVKIISTIADPVVGNEDVTYQFAELIKGADQAIAAATVSDGHDLTVASQPPPSFTIKSVSFDDVTAGGAGKFTFVMECTADIAANVCATVDMGLLQYKLVEDTYTADTLTMAEAQAIFSTAGTAVTMPGDRVAMGASGTVHGGFTTLSTAGPNQMALHPHMILIIQANNASMQYFNVDVATLTQD
jgi:hypothetical protein